MRNRKFLGIVICATIMVAPFLIIEGVNPPAKEDFKPLSLLPKDANFVVVVDMKKVVDTKYYDKFKDEEADLDEYNEFIDKTGIDPETDIDKIAVSLSEMDDNAKFVFIATGRFDKEKILSSIKGEAQIIEEDYQGKTLYMVKGEHKKYKKEVEEVEEAEEEEKEVEIEVEHTCKNEHVRLSFLDSDIVAVSNSELIKKTIDLYHGKGENIESNENLMGVIKEIDRDDMVWGAGVVPEKVKEAAPAEHPMANVLATIKTVVFSVDIKKDLDALFKLKSDCEENVKNITDALIGFIALGKMSYAEKPDYMELLEGITVEGSGDVVSVSMHMSEELLDRFSEEAIMKKHHKKH